MRARTAASALLLALVVAVAAMCGAARAARVASDAELRSGFYDESLVETEAEASLRVEASFAAVQAELKEASRGFMAAFERVRDAVPAPALVGTVGDLVDELREFFGGARGRSAKNFKKYPNMSLKALAADVSRRLKAHKPVPMPAKCKLARGRTDSDCMKANGLNQVFLAARAVERRPPSFFEEAEAERQAALLELEALPTGEAETGAHVDAAVAAFLGESAESRPSAAAAAAPGDETLRRRPVAVYVPTTPVKVFAGSYDLPVECTEKGGDYRLVSLATRGVADIGPGQSGRPATRFCVHRHIHKGADGLENVLVARAATASAARQQCAALRAKGYALSAHDLTPALRHVFTYLCVREPAASTFRVAGSCGSGHHLLTHALPANLGTTRAPRRLCIMPRKRDAAYERLVRDTWVPAALRSDKAKRLADGTYELRFKPLVIIHTQTPLWYRKNNHRWYFSPDKKNWMDCSVSVVKGGRYAGRAPAAKHLEVIEAIRVHEERLLGYDTSLDSAPKWVQAKLGQHPARGGVYTLDSDRWFVTNIFLRRHANRWQWSPDKKVWMGAGQHVVTGGRWKGQHAIGENMDVLDALYVADGGRPKPQPRDSGIRKGLDKMQDALRSCYEKHAEAGFTPQLSVVGVTGNFGSLVAGLETVVDVDTFEIGRFAYGGVQLGTSSFATGVGAYTGVGWKGTSLKTPIADAYSAWFNSVVVGVSTPGIEVGFAGQMAFSSSAKKDEYVATLPVCDQVVTATAGVTFSFDGLAIPVSLDGTSTYYHTHDAINNKCGGTDNPHSCLAFWLTMQGLALSVISPPFGLTFVTPQLLFVAMSM